MCLRSRAKALELRFIIRIYKNILYKSLKIGGLL